jgi:hypothetical protein
VARRHRPNLASFAQSASHSSHRQASSDPHRLAQHPASQGAATAKALGIDLATSWSKIGSAYLELDEVPFIWTSLRTDVMEWPTEAVSARAAAATIDRFARDNNIGAIALDGPQGWRDPARGDQHVGRMYELVTSTPGKTGTFGASYPADYLPFFRFSIDVFAALLDLSHVRLANDRASRTPLAVSEYWLLECFPTSTWRALGLRALPGHTKAPPDEVRRFSRMLRSRLDLPAAAVTRDHDSLQAIVATLPATALLGSKCRAIACGVPARKQAAAGNVPEHLVEGLIWDAAWGST